MANPLLVRVVLPVVFMVAALWQITVFDSVRQSATLRTSTALNGKPLCDSASSDKTEEDQEGELSSPPKKYMYEIDSQSQHEDVSRSNLDAALMNLPASKELPLMNEQGDMIIYYLHIPKTGGTTINNYYRRAPEWRYRMVLGNKQIPYTQEMYDTLRNWKPGTKIFYEHHAGPADPYMASNVRKDLHNWRDMAAKQGIPFFAFTMVREPVSFALSHFNFYYAHQMQFGDRTRFYYVESPTEHDFLNLTLPNPQCLFCVHSELAYHAVGRSDRTPSYVPQERCQDVYDAFALDLDWVGTTENMSNETIPLLEKISRAKYRKVVKNKSEDKISRHNLTQAAVDHIRSITRFDQEIYDRARRDYPMDMWSNLQSMSRRKRNQ